MNWKAVFIAVVSIIIAFIIANKGQPYIHTNDKAVGVIVTVFSVLAGFLIAVIAIVGDPGLMPPGTWRASEQERDKLVLRLNKHKLLFYLYLTTLFIIVVTYLIPEKYESIIVWTERFFLFFGVLAFILSFYLPSSLTRVQIERIDNLIEHKRKESNITKK